MDITKKLMENDPTLIQHNEGFWNESFDASKPGYSSFNDAGVEIETGEFLYAFVRMLKPENVLETGTHWGIGTSYMASALRDNNKGHLDTLEFLPEIRDRARQRVAQLGLEQWVTCHFGDARAFNPGERKYKFILLDTEPQTRFAELIKYFPYLEEGGFVFIHDLHQHMHQVPNEEHGFAWPYGKLPFEIQQLIIENKLRAFHFETPRGLTGFYKVHIDDFKWGR